MIGITAVGTYIPDKKESNYEKLDRFEIEESFVANKIGFDSVAKKSAEETTSDLCVKAFANLASKREIDLSQIDFICVCTQNGDFQLPQTSAIIQSKLGVSIHCAAFDISLGCSGYVYSLHVAKAFMEENGLKNGLLFTADPYSSILDENDKNTSLLFGDAATVTLLSEDVKFELGKAVYLTVGKKYHTLIKRPDEPLFMNGREIFNFCLFRMPALIEKCLEKNQLKQRDIDYYLLHQASKYVLDKLTERAGFESSKVLFTAKAVGNTVSSTIPILLSEIFEDKIKKLLICGFGVGLSAAASILKKKG